MPIHPYFVRTLVQPSAIIQAVSCAFCSPLPARDLVVLRSGLLEVYIVNGSDASTRLTLHASHTLSGVVTGLGRLTPPESDRELIVAIGDKRVHILKFDATLNAVLIVETVSLPSPVTTRLIGPADGSFLLICTGSHIYALLAAEPGNSREVLGVPQIHQLLDWDVCGSDGQGYILALLWLNTLHETHFRQYQLVLDSADKGLIRLRPAQQSFLLPSPFTLLRCFSDTSFVVAGPQTCFLATTKMKEPVIVQHPWLCPMTLSTRCHAATGSTPRLLLHDASGLLLEIVPAADPKREKELKISIRFWRSVSPATHICSLTPNVYFFSSYGNPSVLVYLNWEDAEKVDLSPEQAQHVRVVASMPLQTACPQILGSITHRGPVVDSTFVAANRLLMLQYDTVRTEASTPHAYNRMRCALEFTSDTGHMPELVMQTRQYLYGNAPSFGVGRQYGCQGDGPGSADIGTLVSDAYWRLPYSRAVLGFQGQHDVTDHPSAPIIYTVSGCGSQGYLNAYQQQASFTVIDSLLLPGVHDLEQLNENLFLLRIHDRVEKRYGTALLHATMEGEAPRLTLLPPTEEVDLFHSSVYSICGTADGILTERAFLLVVGRREVTVLHEETLQPAFPALTLEDLMASSLPGRVVSYPKGYIRDLAITGSAVSEDGARIVLIISNDCLVTCRYDVPFGSLVVSAYRRPVVHLSLLRPGFEFSTHPYGVAVSNTGCVAVAFFGLCYVFLLSWDLSSLIEYATSAVFEVSQTLPADTDAGHGYTGNTLLSLLSGGSVLPTDDLSALVALRYRDVPYADLPGDALPPRMALCPYLYDAALSLSPPKSLLFLSPTCLLMTTRSGYIHVYTIGTATLDGKEHFICDAAVMHEFVRGETVVAATLLSESANGELEAYLRSDTRAAILRVKLNSCVDNYVNSHSTGSAQLQVKSSTIRPNVTVVDCAKQYLKVVRLRDSYLSYDSVKNQLLILRKHAADLVCSSMPIMGLPRRVTHCAFLNLVCVAATGLNTEAPARPTSRYTYSNISRAFEPIDVVEDYEAPPPNGSVMHTGLLFYRLQGYQMEQLFMHPLPEDASIASLLYVALDPTRPPFLVVGYNVPSNGSCDVENAYVDVIDIQMAYEPEVVYSTTTVCSHRFPGTSIFDLAPYCGHRLAVSLGHALIILSLIPQAELVRQGWTTEDLCGSYPDLSGEGVIDRGYRFSCVYGYTGSSLLLRISAAHRQIALLDLVKGVSLLDDSSRVQQTLLDLPRLSVVGQHLRHMAPSCIYHSGPNGPLLVGDRYGSIHLLEYQEERGLVTLATHYVGEQVASFSPIILPARRIGRDTTLNDSCSVDVPVIDNHVPVIFTTIGGRIGILGRLSIPVAETLRMLELAMGRSQCVYQSHDLLDMDFLAGYRELPPAERVGLAAEVSLNRYAPLTPELIDEVLEALLEMTCLIAS
ncbi:hypothetical protein GMRT_11516 [Giardia muris]|uniref:Uncharacterized protein n=1 Tax=Giardia muris TaxID=5742 RepID=A0A4Z1T090_GIAMU|nr:hypothetical protein GMRT_11516 [Giardia muris]|eukprot:TNJ27313.1 hypothetical protein GMRT_11516 [Giardia muris]